MGVVIRSFALCALFLCVTAFSPPLDDGDWGVIRNIPKPAASTPNIITVTDKGTAFVYDDVVPQNTITKTNVTIADGASIIIHVGANPAFGAVFLATWNGNNFGLPAGCERAGAASRVTQLEMDGVTGGTGTVTVTMTNSTTGAGAMFSIAQVTGLKAAAASDQCNGAEGSGTSPTVTMGGATAQANEVVFGAVGVDDATGAAGTWQNSFTVLNDVDVTGAGGADGLSVGYRIVSAIGTYTAAKTGIGSAGWSALVSSNKQGP